MAECDGTSWGGFSLPARGPRLLIFLWLAGWHAGLPAAEPADAPERPSVGLVLSGGGARGAAHVGVIKVLNQLQIPVDYVAGTSMGAIVGGLYASGMSADELSEVIETVDWNDWLTDRPPRPQRSFRRKTDDLGFLVDFDVGIDRSGLIFPAGFVQGQNLELALRRLSMSAITVDDFDQLPVPFRAIATDIVTGEAVGSGWRGPDHRDARQHVRTGAYSSQWKLRAASWLTVASQTTCPSRRFSTWEPMC